MSEEVFYLKLAIEGIQKYICSTGKLKEMIGGSEIIDFVASPDFYRPILDQQNLEDDPELNVAPGKYIVAQANAGALCLILPDQASARKFMEAASQKLLTDFPGLPFYGAIAGFPWSDDIPGREACAAGRKKADEIISGQRNTRAAPQGAGLLPVLRAARLDGLPAVARDDGELISLVSAARRNPEMIRRSRERLRQEVAAPAGMELEWKDNLDELLGGEGGKVALICMDGNDLGKLFGQKLGENSSYGLRKSLRQMKELSETIRQCNRGAFNYACGRIAEYEAIHRKKTGSAILMPLRPLVMGGDDITVIARADIALPFVEMFARKFGELGKKDKLSIGIGMVVMSSSYPFALAFALAESLQDSAKNLTRHLEPGKRPSSLDYLVLTEEVENDAGAVRQRLFTCPGGELLTGKPFILKDRSFLEFLDCGCRVVETLPRSQIREAWTVCRKGPAHVRRIWLNLKENIARGLGGRKGRLMKEEDFREIFPDNFFVTHPVSGLACTSLGDFLELERLLPGDEKARADLLRVMREVANV